MNLLRTDHGDGIGHPAVTILGVDTGGTVWVDRDDYRLDFPADDLALMRQVVADEMNVTGTVLRHSFAWDESQVDSLIRAALTSPWLHTCGTCGTRPIVERIDDRCTECGDAAEQRSDESSYTRRLG